MARRPPRAPSHRRTYLDRHRATRRRRPAPAHAPSHPPPCSTPTRRNCRPLHRSPPSSKSVFKNSRHSPVAKRRPPQPYSPPTSRTKPPNPCKPSPRPRPGVRHPRPQRGARIPPRAHRPDRRPRPPPSHLRQIISRAIISRGPSPDILTAPTPLGAKTTRSPPSRQPMGEVRSATPARLGPKISIKLRRTPNPPKRAGSPLPRP